MKNTYYVYQLIDPRSELPFYIGKGTRYRMYEHENKVRSGKVPHRNKYLFNKINKILSLGLSIKYNKIVENVSEKDAFIEEESQIQKYGIGKKGILCNLSYGGEGCSGYVWTTEQLDKFKKVIASDKWRIPYEESRKKVNWDIVRKKQAHSLKTRFANDSKLLKEHRRRMKQVHSTPEARKQNSECLTQFYKEHPEQKQVLSSIQKQLWASGKYDNSKEWAFLSPEGEIIKFKNLNEMCRKNNLTQANMIAVSKGLRNHHKGWRRYTVKIESNL